ncbi:hypothetical protein D9758_013517 [Tetrapyrgos nigripes]|uniref:Uncharacterized protein n=1 Tax=Tetrapyrgos nigripes TaxID=182062 RepID=A0A8H5D2B2_9AGAR|nr:hypothetical protein D9758_013517 [Tetrapyrgos nigripes]
MANKTTKCQLISCIPHLLERVREQYKKIDDQLSPSPVAFFETLYTQYVLDTRRSTTRSEGFQKVIDEFQEVVSTMQRLGQRLYSEGGITSELKEAEELTQKANSVVHWAEDLECGAMEGLPVLERLYTQRRLKFQRSLLLEVAAPPPETTPTPVQATAVVVPAIREVSRPSSSSMSDTPPPALPAVEPPSYISIRADSTQGQSKVYYAWNYCPTPEEIQAMWPDDERSSGYVVSRGMRIGFFAHWAIVEALTTGVSGMFQKKFSRFDMALQEYTRVLSGASHVYSSPKILRAPGPSSRHPHPNRLFSLHDPGLQDRDLKFEVDSHQNIRVYAAVPRITHVSVDTTISDPPGVEVWVPVNSAPRVIDISDEEDE